MVEGDRARERGDGESKTEEELHTRHALLLVGISQFELRIKSRSTRQLFYIQYML